MNSCNPFSQVILCQAESGIVYYHGNVEAFPPTVDGRNSANQLRLVVFPIIYKGFYTSQVVAGFLNHQQYEKNNLGSVRLQVLTNPRRLGLNEVFTLLSFKRFISECFWTKLRSLAKGSAFFKGVT